MKNIEYKVKVVSHRDVLQKLRVLKAQKVIVTKQIDTYMPSKEGRFKIRQIAGHASELIFYKRENKKNSKTSYYSVVKLTAKQGHSVANLFSQAYAKCIVVHKKRELWMYAHTRIHIDTVKKLGKFIELETLTTSLPHIQAKKEHEEVKEKLCLKKYKAISNSYSDLIRLL